MSACRRAGCGILVALLLATACRTSGTQDRALARFEFQRPSMGTLFRVVLYAPNFESADAATSKAWQRLEELNARLSDYDPDSELSRLSRASESDLPMPWTRVSEDLGSVLARALEISAASDGAFDVTCGRATRLWRRAIREGQRPTDESLARARTSIDWRNVEVSAHKDRVRLTAQAMRIDLGGIAKGFALDEMLRVLAECGLNRALVDGGGDVAVAEAPPGERGWRIRLEPSEQEQGPVLLVRHAAVATSGDRYRAVVIDGQRYSHIVDPRTAIALSSTCSASVVAKDGMSADALATAAVVLGASGSERLWSRFEACDFRVIEVAEAGSLVQESPGFRRHVAR